MLSNIEAMKLLSMISKMHFFSVEILSKVKLFLGKLMKNIDVFLEKHVSLK